MRLDAWVQVSILREFLRTNYWRCYEEVLPNFNHGKVFRLCISHTSSIPNSKHHFYCRTFPDLWTQGTSSKEFPLRSWKSPILSLTSLPLQNLRTLKGRFPWWECFWIWYLCEWYCFRCEGSKVRDKVGRARMLLGVMELFCKNSS